MEDIGQQVGGREVLIAAGFKLVTLDGVPSFLSKEPHIESDMGSCSNWFDAPKRMTSTLLSGYPDAHVDNGACGSVTDGLRRVSLPCQSNPGRVSSRHRQLLYNTLS